MSSDVIRSQALVLAEDTRETAGREKHALGELGKVHELLAGQKTRLEHAVGLLNEAHTIVGQVQRMMAEAQQTSEGATNEIGVVASELTGHKQRAVSVLQGTANQNAIDAQTHLQEANAKAFQGNDALAAMHHSFDSLPTQLERAASAVPLAIKLLGQVATRVETADGVVVEQGQHLEESHSHALLAVSNLEQYGGAV